MSDILYDAFHLGDGGYCDAHTEIVVLDGRLSYKDETLAWHGDSPDYFYVQLPKINPYIMRILRRIMPEPCKNFLFEEGALYKVYKRGAVYRVDRSGTVEISNSTFADMAGVL